MRFSLIEAAGWATLATFFIGAVVFLLERLGLDSVTNATVTIQVFLWHTLPFLTVGELALMLALIVWATLFILFLTLALARRPRTQ
jgi:hypothetical protein